MILTGRIFISLSIAAAISCEISAVALVIDLSGINHVLISRPACMAKTFHPVVATGDLFQVTGADRVLLKGIPLAPGRAPESVGRLNVTASTVTGSISLWWASIAW